MLPWSPEFLSVGFALSAVLAVLPLLALHELGHFLAGKLVGLQVLAAGIGFRPPLLVVRHFGTCFYIARPLSMGLTVWVSDRLHVQPGKLIAFSLGGPIASLATTVVPFLLWQLGLHSAPVAAVFWASLFWLPGSLLPIVVRRRQALFRSDAMLAIQYWRGTSVHWDTPGVRLATLAVLRELCRSLDAWPGLISCSLLTALQQVEVGDLDGARRSLDDPSLNDPRRGTFADRLESVVRCAIEAYANPTGSAEIFEQARQANRDDPHALVILKLIEAETTIEAGRTAVRLAQEAKEAARILRQPLLETTADVIGIQADPPLDAAGACREILRRRGARKPTAMLALQLVCTVIAVLAERGLVEEARRLFGDALARLKRLAIELDDQTRDRFLAHASKKLRVAVDATGHGVPLFVEPIAPRRYNSHFGLVGIVCFVLSVLCFVLLGRFAGQFADGRMHAGDLAFLVWLSIALSFCGVFVSLVAFWRPEQRKAAAATALVWNLLVALGVPAILWITLNETALLEPQDPLAERGPDADIAAYTAWIERQPANPSAYRSRGSAFFELGDYDSAIADFSEAILLQPDDAALYRLRARAFLRVGRSDEAAADLVHANQLRMSTEVNPDTP